MARRPRKTASAPVVEAAAEPAVESVVEPVAETPVVEEPVVEKPAKATTPRKPRSVKTEVGPVETKEAPQPFIHEVAPKGLILEANEPLRIEGDVDGNDIVVAQDVYRRVYPASARRPSYLLVYPRGARVPKSILQRL